MFFSKTLFTIALSINCLLFEPADINNTSNSLEIESKSAILLEGSTKTIIFEKEKDTRLNPASITKIMTLLLIFEEIDKGNLKLEDTITVSEHAASMGGSQVFLEEGETQTLKDMIKCICIASANDACVAVSEHISGSEEAFVKKMNERANTLNMKNTNFVNCCGLDVDNHYSSAYDVALMSRELIINHPEITEYTTTWMDTIIHTTKKGSSEFGLTNTNKLVRTYNGITGLKTGSTSLAKYCLSATAKRNGLDMIAVVMSAPEHKMRYQEAAKLLDYGFANCNLYTYDPKKLNLKNIPVKKGKTDTVAISISKPFSHVFTSSINEENITFSTSLENNLTAPVKKNQKVGTVTFYLDNKKIGSSDIITKKTVKKATFSDYLNKNFSFFCFKY